MPEVLTADEAAARLESADSLGIPLGTGQPSAFLEALGRREDWEDLRIYGALLLVWSEVFTHRNAHRDELLEAAERASKGRSPLPPPPA